MIIKNLNVMFVYYANAQIYKMYRLFASINVLTPMNKSSIINSSKIIVKIEVFFHQQLSQIKCILMLCYMLWQFISNRTSILPTTYGSSKLEDNILQAIYGSSKLKDKTVTQQPWSCRSTHLHIKNHAWCQAHSDNGCYRIHIVKSYLIKRVAPSDPKN